ncbi:MAG: M1 family metallopeptidase [Bacteroidales bacterium]|nr:M1 family metallopeptidase [Bacteroidales bacterium]
MIVRYFVVALAGVLFAGGLQAQEKDFFLPRELQKAYQQETRSYTGVPGENYFQNTADYDIDARFEPESGELRGEQIIAYRNNSPDTLKNLVMRVFMNIFQKGVERDFDVGPVDLHDGVEIENLRVNGEKVDGSGIPRLLNGRGTIQTIRLADPVLPGEQVNVSMRWKVQLPQHVAIRMGQYGKGHNWFVAYWYPHISVYDDVYGWDTHPFTGSAEFYYDFNDYEVRLTVPGDYMVWATGILQNPEEHYQGNILSRISQAKRTEEVVPIVTAEDLEKESVLKDRRQHTWHFTASQVPDFSFAVSKKYIWDGTSLEVDHQTGRRTFVSAVYDTSSVDFHQVAEVSRESIRMFSEEIMGVPFAYPKLTAFNGSGGMEFPMMINDGDVSSYQGTVHLTAHEIGHNYFPFYVMTNESYYAFMDEGLISFLPRIVEEKMIEGFNPFESLVQGYAFNAGNGMEVPLMVKSYMLSDYAAYRIHAYQRPGTAFYHLRELVGEEDFHKALRAYIIRWAKKHPTPYDFFYTCEDVLDRDLGWFWKPWFFEFGYPDLAVGKLHTSGSGQYINILKKGNIPVPIHLTVIYNDGSKEVIERSAEVWKTSSQHHIAVDAGKDIRKIQLGHANIPDAFPNNNTYE